MTIERKLIIKNKRTVHLYKKKNTIRYHDISGNVISQHIFIWDHTYDYFQIKYFYCDYEYVNQNFIIFVLCKFLLNCYNLRIKISATFWLKLQRKLWNSKLLVQYIRIYIHINSNSLQCAVLSKLSFNLFMVLYC